MPSSDPPPDRGFLEEEHRVKAHSDAFKKELGLRDLVLTQIVFVVGTSWVGTAAKLGPSQTAYWLFAILLFYLPVAAVIIYLNRIMPLEGGLDQWAKLGFNEFTGFIVAWNLWLLGVSVMAGTGLVIATNLSYALGPAAAWLPASRLFVSALNGVLFAVLILVTIRGLSIGKWVHNVGAHSPSYHLRRARRPALHRPRPRANSPSTTPSSGRSRPYPSSASTSLAKWRLALSVVSIRCRHSGRRNARASQKHRALRHHRRAHYRSHVHPRHGMLGHDLYRL